MRWRPGSISRSIETHLDRNSANSTDFGRSPSSNLHHQAWRLRAIRFPNSLLSCNSFPISQGSATTRAPVRTVAGGADRVTSKPAKFGAQAERSRANQRARPRPSLTRGLASRANASPIGTSIPEPLEPAGQFALGSLASSRHADITSRGHAPQMLPRRTRFWRAPESRRHPSGRLVR